MAFMTMDPIPLPPSARQVLDTLHRAGYEAWIVGGAVRDAVSGLREPHDWDVTTDALPEQTAALFPAERVIPTGLKHGTVTVLADGLPVEVTTFRVDGDYSDHRHPDRVRFTRSLEEDLARRDFTMNAMAYDPRQGLYDPFGGAADLRAGLVRCVGEPDRRFGEDALRILRALRFASQFRMEIEGETAAAARRGSAMLREVAAERVQEELTRLLLGPGAAAVLREFGEVAAVPIPELTPAFGLEQHNPHHDRDVWEHTLAVVDAVPDQDVLRWAALLHDLGKPACFTRGADGVGHFYGHGEQSLAIARRILRRLRFDNDRRERIELLVRLHDAPLEPERRILLRLLRRCGEEGTRQLIALHRADTLGQSPMSRPRLARYDEAEKLLDALLNEQACFSLKDLAVDGRDAMALGLRGPAVGRALNACLDAVTECRAPNEREGLLALLRRYAEENE